MPAALEVVLRARRDLLALLMSRCSLARVFLGGEMDADNVQAVAAVFTFLAACVAVWAAFRAPKLAAAFAEELRQRSTAADEARRQKIWILSTLMQHRATFEFPDAVNALNAISLVFVEDQEVRDAYTHFLAAAGRKGSEFQHAELRERYLALIEKIVRNLGMNRKITVADIHEGYFPHFMSKQRMLLAKDIDDRFDAAFPGVQDRMTKGE